MSFRTILVAVLALVCGVSAAIAVGQLQKKGGTTPSQVETVEIAVAAVDIPRGTTIAPEMVTMCAWPKKHVPATAILSAEEVAERTALTALAKDEPLLEGKIAAGRGLAPLIPDGMRATAVQITESSGVAGFILPGNKVDVLLSLSTRGTSHEDASTQTLLQQVEVLAVGQLLDAPNENNFDVKSTRSVTLLVTPQQSALLELAKNEGTLSLTLRSDSDNLAASTRPITKRELRGLEEPPFDMSKVRNLAIDLAKTLKEGFQSKDKPTTNSQTNVKEFHIRTIRGGSEGSINIRRESYRRLLSAN
jgi:pilus assembly protein CpaB